MPDSDLEKFGLVMRLLGLQMPSVGADGTGGLLLVVDVPPARETGDWGSGLAAVSEALERAGAV